MKMMKPPAATRLLALNSRSRTRYGNDVLDKILKTDSHLNNSTADLRKLVEVALHRAVEDFSQARCR